MFKIPKKTSRYAKETKLDKYILLFAPELIGFIKKKKKFKTYRFGLKYDYLKVGDRVKIQDFGSKKIIAKAIITKKKQTIFKKIPVKIEGHVSYRDKKHQRDVFSGYYAYLGKKIKDDDLFLIISFELM